MPHIAIPSPAAAGMISAYIDGYDCRHILRRKKPQCNYS